MNPTNKNAAPSYTLNCRMAQEAAAIERLCQVVRIRGFRIASMAVETAGDYF
ncbi:MAG: acetolactate synthase II small subunit, partial [Marinobacter sp. T13-3]